MKSLKHGARIINSYLLLTESVCRAARTYINNPKVGEALELLEKSLEETVEKHAEEVVKAYKEHEATIKDMTVEEMEAAAKKEAEERETRIKDMFKGFDDLDDIFKKRDKKTDQ